MTDDERLRAAEDDVSSRIEALLAIGRDTAPRLTEQDRLVDHAELLYDEHGLPR